ncbi:MAG: peptidase, partial [Flavobacteriales bacterium CG_4_10_14_0_2_um_filter_35_18]
MQKTLLGRTDIVDFPKLNLFNIDVKIDTGAYTSSFHCHHIELSNGVLKFQLLDPE